MHAGDRKACCRPDRPTLASTRGQAQALVAKMFQRADNPLRDEPYLERSPHQAHERSRTRSPSLAGSRARPPCHRPPRLVGVPSRQTGSGRWINRASRVAVHRDAAWDAPQSFRSARRGARHRIRHRRASLFLLKMPRLPGHDGWPRLMFAVSHRASVSAATDIAYAFFGAEVVDRLADGLPQRLPVSRCRCAPRASIASRTPVTS